jgi:hypothetical protein
MRPLRFCVNDPQFLTRALNARASCLACAPSRIRTCALPP